METRQSGTLVYAAWQMRDPFMRGRVTRGSNPELSKLTSELARKFIRAHGGRRLRSGRRPVISAFDTASAAVEAILELAAQLRESRPGGGSDCLTAALYMAEARGDENDLGLSRVKQLLDTLGHGQVVVSLPVQDIMRDRLPEGFRFDDVGTVSLGEPVRRERIFALVDSTEPRSQRRSLDLDLPSPNLPIQQTAFFGRYMEIAAIREAMDGSRLITLTGTAGVGKTRVALHTTHLMLDEIPGTAAFVDLTPLKSAKSAAQAILDALLLKRDPGIPLLENLIEGIGDMPILLLLDNCEHLLPQLSTLVGNLLTQCSQLKVLATSREPLRLKSERTVLIPAMETPDESEENTPERLLSYESIRLFVDRADASRAGFRLTESNAADVASICRKLDGIPLALELAASKMNLLTPAQLLSRMVSQFDLLSSSAINIDPKHRTLWSALAWSYQALTAAESALFRRLAVFQDHFTIETVEGAFANDPALKGEEALALLAQLLDKSLITVRDIGDNRKVFRLFAAVHEFALNQLKIAGEYEEACKRHFEWYYSVALVAADDKDECKEGDWLTTFDTDYDNFRAALVWCLANTETSKESCNFCYAFTPYWSAKGLQHEGRMFIEESIVRFGLDDIPTIACQHVNASCMAEFEGKWQIARTHLDKAMALCEQAGFAKGLAGAGRNLAVLLERERKFEEALIVSERAAKIFQELGDEGSYWSLQTNIVYWLAMVGRTEEAVSLGVQVVDKLTELGANEAISLAELHLAEAYVMSGQSDKAELLVEESIRRYRGFGADFKIGRSLDVLARIAMLRAQYERAAVLLGSSMALCETDGLTMNGIGRDRSEDLICDLRLALAEHFESFWERGLGMDEEEAAAYALGAAYKIPTYRRPGG